MVFCSSTMEDQAQMEANNGVIFIRLAKIPVPGSVLPTTTPIPGQSVTRHKGRLSGIAGQHTGRHRRALQQQAGRHSHGQS